MVTDADRAKQKQAVELRRTNRLSFNQMAKELAVTPEDAAELYADGLKAEVDRDRLSPRQMTDRQAQAVDLRNLGRLTFRKVGQAMGISAQAAHDHYKEGMKFLVVQEEQPVAQSYSRLEKREYIDDRLALYDRIARANMEDHPRTAIEALNGAYKYLELLIRIEGLEAPQRHSLEITMQDVDRKIQVLEGKLQADGSYDL